MISFTNRELNYILAILSEDYRDYGTLLPKDTRMMHEEVMDKIKERYDDGITKGYN